ncbi:hypothetical protein PFISCL1PPCAC_14943 [Pristionchus fissidentatus]|uniref:Protein kinase domain-containing protein n=1 Tax=Pristionchus fissidentatus TaxID=1538716 RepID=A0AAV5VYT3_9BILA|nr:hypothetical protein PFISCL1PPCAC_14943 [Pristionchus fissidentatus]
MSADREEEESPLPQVGMIIEHESGQWRVLRNIASGPFSDVFFVSDVSNSRQKYAMKVEKQNGNIRAVLKLDVMVLSCMQRRGAVGFPRMIAAGRTSAYKYLVMQMLGPDLGKLRRSLPEKRFSLATALKVALQTVDRLQALHDAGWLCRDVKAPNLVVGINDDEDNGQIYMLDFGFARRFRDSEGNRLPPRPNAALVGTFQYAPLAAHAHKDQSPKDDLESWFYMTVELIKGPLPWGSFKDYHQMGDYKKAIRNEKRVDFLYGCPEELGNILDSIDGTTFFDEPQYDLIRRELRTAAVRADVDMETPFDWQIQRWMLRRAHFVGDLGESNMASERLANDTTADSDDDRSSLPVETTPPLE